MSLIIADVTRPNLKFNLDIWGDRFLAYDQEEQDGVEQVIEDLKEDVKKEILRDLNIPTQHAELLKLIDALERLGIAYYFEEEINQVFHHIFTEYGNKWMGGNISLWFRLMRQHGYFVSSDIFSSYKDKEGRFKESLRNDVHELLELYEATFTSVPGEVILDEALIFTRTYLDAIAKDSRFRSSTVSSQIREALKEPLHRRLVRIEALRYIPFYQQQASHDETLLKLAKLGFNQLQSLHKKELCQITKWWKRYDVPNNLPYARNRPVECYFWAFSVYYEPQYSVSRVFLARFMLIQTFLDDSFDVYGTVEELERFNEAIQRWSVTCLDGLPQSFKLIFQIIVDIFEEIEEILSKDGKQNQVNYIKEALKECVQCYLQEAKWAKEDYIPTLEEQTEVSYISIGYKLTLVAGFACMGNVIGNDSFEWALTNPPLVHACNLLCRVNDDINPRKDEQDMKHNASIIQCYMKQFDASEEEAYESFNIRIEDAWKELNRDFMIMCKDRKAHTTAIRVTNFARSLTVVYKNRDNFTAPGVEMINHLKSLFVDPILT